MENDIISPENLVYQKPTLMNDVPMHYCPGCSHGVVHKLVAEVIEEMGMEDKAVGICPVGCAVFAYRYLDIDWQEAAHGRAPALTTLMGQKTSTCPYGRVPELHGYPLKITEIAATLEGTCYVSRQSVETVAAIRGAKKAIRKAFEASMAGKGSSLVEIVSTCSSGWKLSPQKANEWMEENMFKFYPKGDLKDTIK